MQRNARALVLAVLCISGFVTDAGAASKLDDARAELQAYQAKDQRLHDIGWRLVLGNAPYCDGARLSVGLQLLDTAGFSNIHCDALPPEPDAKGPALLLAIADKV